jgi:hypothetical protein
MRRGDVDEMSFAFRVTKNSWNSDYSERNIEAVNLHRGDVSIVSFGANPATMAMVRSALANDDVRTQLLAEFDLGGDEPVVAGDADVVVVDADVVVERAEDGHCQDSAVNVSYYYEQLLERSA